MQQTEKAQIAEQYYSLAQLAQQYEPYIYLDTNRVSPPAVCNWYEVIEQPNNYVLVYHLEWRDEIAPNPLLDYLYGIYRGAVYGVPLKDVEYIQLTIEKKTGSILAVKFETNTPQSQYDTNLQAHHYVSIFKTSNNYFKVIKDGKGAIVKEEIPIQLMLADDTHLLFNISTWNHLLQLSTIASNAQAQQQIFPLQYLDDTTYVTDNYARKGQGDFKSEETGLVKWSASFYGLFKVIFKGLGRE